MTKEYRGCDGDPRGHIGTGHNSFAGSVSFADRIGDERAYGNADGGAVRKPHSRVYGYADRYSDGGSNSVARFDPDGKRSADAYGYFEADRGSDVYPAPTATTQPGDGWNVEYDGTASTATVTVPKDAQAGESISLFIAEYNEDGILTDLEAIDIEIEAGRTEYEIETQKGIVQNEENRVRLFLWDSGYRPLL